MIREKTVRNKKWLVVIDIIRDCNPSNKPSKIWSEYKKKKDPPFTTSEFEFKASNGRVYELECVGEKDKAKVIELFSPKRKTAAPKLTTTKTGLLKVEAPVNEVEEVVVASKKRLCLKALVASIRNLADHIESI